MKKLKNQYSIIDNRHSLPAYQQRQVLKSKSSIE